VADPTAVPGGDTPATVSAEIKAMAVEWEPITALLGGTKAMREARGIYLPKHPAESDEVYSYRLKVSTLFNGFRRTVETMSSKPFSEPLELKSDVPETIRIYAEDIDLEGRNLQAFAHEVFGTALAYGLSHILVDYPTVTSGLTLADQRNSGARPYFVEIKPWNVLGWKSQRILGVETLTQLRIMETIQVPSGVWTTKTVRQVRVLEPNSYRIFRQAKDDPRAEWNEVESGPVSIGAIPLATIYGGRTGFMTAKPPLMDLAYLNIEHWQSKSDQQNILHVARVPILFGSGFANEQLKIGAGYAVSNDDPTSTLEYVDSGRAAPAIDAGRDSLKDLEDSMRVLGAQLLVKRPRGTRTATETSIDSNEADSTLSLLALNMQDSLEFALDFMAKWDKIPSGGSIKLCDDFSEWDEGMSGFRELLDARKLGIVSAQTTFEEMGRRDVISDERTWEVEQARLKAEPPVVGIIGNYESIGGAPTKTIGAGTPAP
jgi:Domain of unknown function (DUF4055)